MNTLGHPRVHLRETTSTNDRARELAQSGAPHGTVVTASAQSAGRGRQGRTWSAPPGTALLMSVVLRSDAGQFGLLPLAAAVAVARTCGDAARIKWPNDVHLDGRKVSGILAEGRPQEGWAVLGIGLNVALKVEDLPPELHETATTLGRSEEELEPTLRELLDHLQDVLALPTAELLDAYRARDTLLGREIHWNGGSGIGDGIDGAGRLVVLLEGGGHTALDAGEVHIGRV